MAMQVSSRAHLYQFSCVKTARPTPSWPPRKVKAWSGLISPDASGLNLVRSVHRIAYAENQRLSRLATFFFIERAAGSARQPNSPTFLSMSRSHKSLIVQPAPRITIAPVPNRARFHAQLVTGNADEYAAIVIPQAGPRTGKEISPLNPAYRRTTECSAHRMASTRAKSRSVCPSSRGSSKGASTVDSWGASLPISGSGTSASQQQSSVPPSPLHR